MSAHGLADLALAPWRIWATYYSLNVAYWAAALRAIERTRP